jgi:hypothetical protein
MHSSRGRLANCTMRWIVESSCCVLTLLWGDFIVQQGEGQPCLGLRSLHEQIELQKEVTSLCMRVCSLKECDN